MKCITFVRFVYIADEIRRDLRLVIPTGVIRRTLTACPGRVVHELIMENCTVSFCSVSSMMGAHRLPQLLFFCLAFSLPTVTATFVQFTHNVPYIHCDRNHRVHLLTLTRMWNSLSSSITTPPTQHRLSLLQVGVVFVLLPENAADSRLFHLLQSSVRDST